MECNQSTLAECLQDPETLTCCSYEETSRLRCIILARLKELMCGCMSSPVRVDNVYYESAATAINALRQLLVVTYDVQERSAELEGPVMETIWQDGCGAPRCRPVKCGEVWRVGCDVLPNDYAGQYHRSSDCVTDPTPSAGETCE